MSILCCGPLAAEVADEKVAGEIHETEVAGSKEPRVANSNYKIWIPDGASSLRTLFVINHRAAGKHMFFRDAEWRALAVRTSSGIMYCEFETKAIQKTDTAHPCCRLAISSR